MEDKDLENWKAVDLNTLVDDVISAVENGEIDSVFDNEELVAGPLSRTKTARNLTKNYLMACLHAGLDGVSEASAHTALGLVNAFRHMNGESLLRELPDSYRVYSIRLPRDKGNPDIEIYIKDGHRVLYGEKIYPRGVLTEHFLLMAESVA